MTPPADVGSDRRHTCSLVVVFRELLLLCLSAVVFGCSTSGLDSVQITPTTQSLTVGQTAQFTVVGHVWQCKAPYDSRP